MDKYQLFLVRNHTKQVVRSVTEMDDVGARATNDIFKTQIKSTSPGAYN